MSMVISYSVGHGDMFSVRHNNGTFTIIDCRIYEETKKWILETLKREKGDAGVTRFISTHPDQDHLDGLVLLDEEMPIVNFYCIRNKVIKDEETEDFERYKALRDSDKAFYVYTGATRHWLNDGNNTRGGAGLHFLWPDPANLVFQEALAGAEDGDSPNNTSVILRFHAHNRASFLWMGDMETGFMEAIEDAVAWPKVDVLFAPHHGRDSGRVPASILAKMDPKIIVLGEAQSEHLCYYPEWNTITQNSTGSIAFETADGYVHIYVDSDSYSVDFLQDVGASRFTNYIGSLPID